MSFHTMMAQDPHADPALCALFDRQTHTVQPKRETLQEVAVGALDEAIAEVQHLWMHQPSGHNGLLEVVNKLKECMASLEDQTTYEHDDARQA